MFVWNFDVLGIVILGSCIGYICIHLLIQAIKDFVEKKKRKKEEETKCR